jgi:hypothetical protein
MVSLMRESNADSLIETIKHTQSLKTLFVHYCNLSKNSEERLWKAAQLKKHFKVLTKSFWEVWKNFRWEIRFFVHYINLVLIRRTTGYHRIFSLSFSNEEIVVLKNLLIILTKHWIKKNDTRIHVLKKPPDSKLLGVLFIPSLSPSFVRITIDRTMINRTGVMVSIIFSTDVPNFEYILNEFTFSACSFFRRQFFFVLYRYYSEKNINSKCRKYLMKNSNCNWKNLWLYYLKVVKQKGRH